MENYDIIMLVVLSGAMLFGAFKGFAWQLASITSIVLSYFVAYRFREPLSLSIQADPPWNRFLAMLILYVGTSLVIWVAFRMVSKTIDRLKLKEFDRQVGAMFGLAKGALYCVLITLFSVTLLGDNIREQVVQSKSGRYIAQVLDRSESIIPAEIQEVVGPYIEKFDERVRQAPGLESGLSPWLDQVTESGIPEGPWKPNLPSATSSPSRYSAPTFQPPSEAARELYRPSMQQAERPWSSVYSSSGNR